MAASEFYFFELDIFANVRESRTSLRHLGGRRLLHSLGFPDFCGEFDGEGFVFFTVIEAAHMPPRSTAANSMSCGVSLPGRS